jgi:large conductance mechanosensitive channel
MKSFFREFRDFITQGNLMEVASGLLLATAFRDLISSFSNTFILPLINKALNYSSNIADSDSTVKVAGLNINYGAFLTELISFLITGIVLFLMIKLYTKLASKRKPVDTELSILKEIRDSLNKK